MRTTCFAIGTYLVIAASTTAWSGDLPAAALESDVVATTNDDEIAGGVVRQYILDVGGEVVYRNVFTHDVVESVLWGLKQYVACPIMAASAEAEGLDGRPAVSAALRASKDDLVLKILHRQRVRDPLGEVAAEDVRTWFEETYPDGYPIPEQIEFQHIFLRVAGSAPESAWLETEERATTLRKRILAGEDFAAVAQEVAAGEQTVGMAPGAIIRPDMSRLNPEIKRQCLAIQPGELTQPFRTPYGVELVRLVGYQAPDYRGFEEVRDEMDLRYWQERSKEMFNEYLVEAKDRFPLKTVGGFPEALPAHPEQQVMSVGPRAVDYREFQTHALAEGMPLVGFEDVDLQARQNLVDKVWGRVARVLLAEAEGVESDPEYIRRWRAVREKALSDEWLRWEIDRIRREPTQAELAAHLRDASQAQAFMLPPLRSGWEIRVAVSTGDEASPADIYLAWEDVERNLSTAADQVRAGSDIRDAVAGLRGRYGDRVDFLEHELLDRHPGGTFDLVARDLEQGEIAKPTLDGRHGVLCAVEFVVPARQPELEEVRTEVREDWIRLENLRLESEIFDAIVESQGLTWDEGLLRRMLEAGTGVED